MSQLREHASRRPTARGRTTRHRWTAPPRNHDWIAARIGRG
jgi:hypothetical protein